jgi:hypothetical protein
VNRTNRPNTWLHRPSLRRDDSSCQPGAVHTWHNTAQIDVRSNVGYWGISGIVAGRPNPTFMTRSGLREHSRECFEFLDGPLDVAKSAFNATRQLVERFELCLAPRGGTLVI